jgi:hypothetical protein
VVQTIDHYAKGVERALLPPGPSGKCCWQYFFLIAVDGLAMLKRK